MRHLLILALLTLSACATTPVPIHDPKMAWVDLRGGSPGDSFLADRLDRQRLSDGRYFQMTPGSHELEARYRFERPAMGNPMSTDSTEITCVVRVRYASFEAGKRYRLEARPLPGGAQAWFYGNGREPLARGEVLRCGPV
ncbi:hypothetical protein [Pseudomonas sp. LRF_L74]|uniref:PA0061/PA0062 family lipoprotein n=1 Tax=Pseudomonas sp. LRF_L74 TaxID=3369422 RepID=UPI003F61DA09